MKEVEEEERRRELRIGQTGSERSMKLSGTGLGKGTESAMKRMRERKQEEKRSWGRNGEHQLKRKQNLWRRN